MVTPEQNAEAIAQLTETVQQLSSAVDVLVSQFIRPNAQQALANYERLERLEGLVETMALQQQENREQISANTQQGAAFDRRLEETRELVAQNGSNIAQMGSRQEQMFERLDDHLLALARKIDSNAEQVTALAETSRTQLAAIIGNGRRIERLEQQAS